MMKNICDKLKSVVSEKDINKDVIIQQYERASVQFEQLVGRGVAEKRGYCLEPLTGSVYLIKGNINNK